MRLALVLLVTAAPGCLELGGFACSQGSCDLDGRDGVCEPQGWCSYPDEACASGRRFESRAPSVGGRCVEPSDTSGGDTSTAGTTGAGTTSVATLGSTSSMSSTGSDEASSSATGPSCDGDGCGWTQVESGPTHTCAVDGNGAVWCWGLADSGQLGNGTNAQFQDCPEAPAEGLAGQLDLSVGGHTCSLDAEGLYCWGPNDDDQIDPRRAVPDDVLVPHLVELDGKQVTAFGVGATTTCVALGSQVICRGGGEDQTFSSPAVIEELGVGADHMCGLLEDRRLWCVGEDDLGQLGGGPGLQGPAVQPQLGGDDAVVIAVGAAHTCVLTESDDPTDRTVKCWGANDDLQAGGVPKSAVIEAPTDVSGGLVDGPWVDVATGVSHSCAIDASGEVWCWGTNDYGQIDPHAETPGERFTARRIELDPPIDAVDIAATTTFTCALDRAAKWWCWGCLEPWQATGGRCEVSPPTLIEPCG